MKVLLINTPTKYSAMTTADWDTTAEDIGAFPPIGLSYIAGYLIENTNHEVKIIDALAERLEYDELEQLIIQATPDVVGLSAFTATFYDTMMVVRIVRKNFPNCHICVGGAHINTHLVDTLHHHEIDSVCRGEGEVIFANLVNALSANRPISEVEGISFKDSTGEIIGTGSPGYQSDLNALPQPAFHLLPLHLYKSAVGTGKTVGVIATSRGCPYDCTFCNRPYRSFRSYSVERTLDEMQVHYDKGTREFLFFDDMFNIKPQRVIDHAEGIKERFPGISWAFRGRVEQVTAEMVRKAKESGCFQILFGADGGSEEDFENIRKKISLKQVKEAMTLCKKEGIETGTNWIIGLPTHRTREDVLALLDFAIDCGADYAQFHILIPYADAPLYPEGVEKNILPEKWWHEYTRDPTPNAFIPMWEEHLSRQEISELLKICYRKFYLRPSKILTNAFRLRNFEDFKVKFKGLMTILGKGGFSRNEAT